MNPPDQRPDQQQARARMPADVDAPDKILYGLTFRQLAILAVAAVVFYAAWRGLHRLVPVPVLLGGGLILGGLAFGLVVGRRDGLSLDRWLLHAVVHSRAPKALSTGDTTTKAPEWVQAPQQRVALPAPLKKTFETQVDEVSRQAYAEIAKVKFALDGTSTYPDATFTLRLAFGLVKGYEENGKKVTSGSARWPRTVTRYFEVRQGYKHRTGQGDWPDRLARR